MNRQDDFLRKEIRHSFVRYKRLYGTAQAVVSAGNSGAALVAALVLGGVPGAYAACFRYFFANKKKCYICY